MKFTHPIQGERLRFSLQTRDATRAEVLRRQIEHEVELSKLKRLEIPLPEEIAAALELPSTPPLAAPADILPTEESPTPVETISAAPEPQPTLVAVVAGERPRLSSGAGVTAAAFKTAVADVCAALKKWAQWADAAGLPGGRREEIAARFGRIQKEVFG